MKYYLQEHLDLVIFIFLNKITFQSINQNHFYKNHTYYTLAIMLTTLLKSQLGFEPLVANVVAFMSFELPKRKPLATNQSSSTSSTVETHTQKHIWWPQPAKLILFSLTSSIA